MLCNHCDRNPAAFRVHDSIGNVACTSCLSAAVARAVTRLWRFGIPGSVDPGELDVVGVSLLEVEPRPRPAIVE